MALPSTAIAISDEDATQSEEGSSVEAPAAGKPGKRKLEANIAANVEWMDDSDASDWKAFKKRKVAEKAVRNARGKPPAHGASSRASWNKKSARHSKGGLPDTGGTAHADEDFPLYLQKRRGEFDAARRTLKEAGLRLPPDYSDIYFSDEEGTESLEERPQFDARSGIQPCREYKEVFFRETLGIIPASIAQYLRDYQIEGVKFLHGLFVYQNGGILGDDMGLGKTVQVAAFLAAAFGKTGDRRDSKRMRKFRRSTERWYPRALIICPGSLTQNWKNELDRWGWWNTDLYHGAGKRDVLNSARAGRLEIVITTYTTYKNSRNQVNSVDWDVVVADECHSIKDGSAEVTRAMNEVNALCRIGLTGTAIQNRYEELWTILNWTNPGALGSMSEWKQTICKPLTVGQSHDATRQQLSTARKTARLLKENLLPRFFLRRMKSLIAHQLPKKTDKVVFCPLSQFQRDAYQSCLESPLALSVKTAFLECDCGSGSKRGFCCYQFNKDGESWRTLVFPLIMSLQKLSSHLALLIPQQSDTGEKQRRDMRFLKAAAPNSWRQLHSNRDSLLSLSNPEYCGKWVVLSRLLRFWHGNGDKVLVFSHSVRLLKILRHLFNNTSYSVSYLDGTLSYEERQKTVDDFNSDPSQFVFLISTKAGGVGLNITSANKVVIMDPHWNPAYDLQAQDRAYRIGQVRDVDVYRLISAGTIEEVVYGRQIYKQQQANIGYNASNERRYFKGVQQDAERKGEIFGIDNLLEYHGDQIVLRDIVNKTNIAEAKVGVSLADIDMGKIVDDELGAVKKENADDQDGGLDELAELLTKSHETAGSNSETSAGTKKKSDAIQAILASAGVEYTHENSEVVGSSKIEDRLSRLAEENASEDTDAAGRALFFDSEAEGEVSDHHLANLRYNPPDSVKQRQFCTMAKTFGFPSATNFALAVESMTQEERRNSLDLFYRKRLARLSEMSSARRASTAKQDTDTKQEMGIKRPAKNEVNTATRKHAVVKGEGSAGGLSSAEVRVKEAPPGNFAGVKPGNSIWLSDEDDEL